MEFSNGNGKYYWESNSSNGTYYSPTKEFSYHISGGGIIIKYNDSNSSDDYATEMQINNIMIWYLTFDSNRKQLYKFKKI
jgi:hypothetical protein